MAQRDAEQQHAEPPLRTPDEHAVPLPNWEGLRTIFEKEESTFTRQGEDTTYRELLEECATEDPSLPSLVEGREMLGDVVGYVAGDVVGDVAGDVVGDGDACTHCHRSVQDRAFVCGVCSARLCRSCFGQLPNAEIHNGLHRFKEYSGSRPKRLDVYHRYLERALLTVEKLHHWGL
jgi:hypothetical protein